MKFKQSVLGCAIVAACVLPSLAEAAVRFKVGQGLTGTAEQEMAYAGGGGWTQSGDYTPTSIGITAIDPDSHWFVDLTYVMSSNDADFSGGLSGTYERSDTSLTFGQADEEGFSYFFGWREGNGETDLAGSVDTLTARGLTMGLSQTFPLNEQNVFALSMGLGVLEGTWEVTSASYDADWTVGGSVGLGYAYQLTQSVALGLEYKYQTFEFSFIDDFGDENILDETLSYGGAFAQFTF